MTAFCITTWFASDRCKNQRPKIAATRLAILLLVLGLAGCHAVDYYPASLQAPVPPTLLPPTEKCPVSLASYRIEPPDILHVEVLKLVPLPPYRIDIYDMLQIEVMGVMDRDRPINGFFLVEGEGTVTLGAAYGKVRIAGMTVEEAAKAITDRLKAIGYADPLVSVQFSRSFGTATVTDDYMVGPDGTINLRQYGILSVAGKTVPEVRVDLQRLLSQYFDSPEVAVEVRAYNSKVFYVITQGAGIGDNVRRFQINGYETVLDALAEVNGLSQLSSTLIWVARPAPSGFGCDQIMPVDYEAMVQGGSTATNYQLMPGDRVFIAEDNVTSLNNYVAKITQPIERLLGLTGLGVNTVRSSQTMGRDYNRTRNSF